MRILALHGSTVCSYPDGEPVPFPPVPSSVTIGSYDGLHVGHRDIIAETVRQARHNGLRSVVVTFEPHPRLVLDPGPSCPVRLLTTLDEKISLLDGSGVDLLLVVRFDRAFADRSSEWFISEVLCGLLDSRHVVIGYDHGFGHDRSGSERTLRALGGQCGFTVDVIGEVIVGQEPVSSTRIRRLLLDGAIREANACLGTPYLMGGVVVEGQKLGRTIGFPTVNLQPPPCKLIPAHGVYVARTEIDGRSWPAMMNIGVRPTVSRQADLTVEAHILGWSGDLYGQELRFSLLDFLRHEQQFGSLEQLRARLEEDKKMVELYRQ